MQRRDAHDFVRYAYQRAATVRPEASPRILDVILEDLVFRDESGASNLDETLVLQRTLVQIVNPGVTASEALPRG